MSIIGYTRVTPEKVWATWSHAQGNLIKGSTGYKSSGTKKIFYKIVDVVPGKSFSVLWKALFVSLIFSHEVIQVPTGTEIRYDFRLEGRFAWLIRWWVSPRIKANLSLVLKAFIQQLESNFRI